MPGQRVLSTSPPATLSSSSERVPALAGRSVLTLLAAALLFCAAAVWNGQPFYYPDTPTYLRGAEGGVVKLLGPDVLQPWLPAKSAAPDKLPPTTAGDRSTATPGQSAAATPHPRQMKALTSIDDKLVLAGRSVYYGALLYAGFLAGDMWLAIIVQAVCVAYVLQLLMQRLWGVGTGKFLLVAGALVLCTPLGVYTGFLMPDIFAPLVVLATGVLAVYWRQLGSGDRWALGGVLLFGLCAHNSHLALALLMLLVIASLRLSSKRLRQLPVAALVTLACYIGAGVVAELAFSKAVVAAVGAPPLRLPHSTARLIDMGPGTDFLARHCPEANYAACAYLANYPTKWDDFLFSDDPAKGAFALADTAGKRRMAGEQGRFAIDVLKQDFFGVAAGVGADVLRQTGRFAVDIWGYSDRGLAMYAGRVPERIYERMERIPYSAINAWLTRVTQAAVLASLALASLWLWRRTAETNPNPEAQQRQGEFALFAWIVIAGVLCNAIVCAVFASSLDRFQARVIWLLPFLALAVLAGASRSSALAGVSALSGPAAPHSALGSSSTAAVAP